MVLHQGGTQNRLPSIQDGQWFREREVNYRTKKKREVSVHLTKIPCYDLNVS
jgi:hypothetical protein